METSRNRLLKKASGFLRRQFATEAQDSNNSGAPSAIWPWLPMRCTLTYNEYGSYCVPEHAAHRPACQAILAHRVWEPETVRFMRDHCADGDIVHAGTFFGDFLPALSSALAPGAMLIAFEPVAENYQCAKVTATLNGLSNVSLTQAGLGANPARLKMITHDDHGRSLGGGSTIVNADSAEGDQDVAIIRVDDSVRPDHYVSVIQLDIEGHEKAALEGALQTILHWRPILILETLPGSTLTSSTWFEPKILRIGYKPIGKLHDNEVYAV
jgi:FkbM family methyltransferase